MASALSVAPYNSLNSPWRRLVILPVVVQFDSGAPSIDTTRSANGVAVTGSAGDYQLTFPSASKALALSQVYQVTPAGAFIVVNDVVATSGTLDFEWHAGDLTSTAETPGDTDEAWIFLHLEGG